MTALAKIDGHKFGGSDLAGVGTLRACQDASRRPWNAHVAQRSQRRKRALLVGIASARSPRHTELYGTVWRTPRRVAPQNIRKKSAAARRRRDSSQRVGTAHGRSVWAALQAAHHDHTKRLSIGARSKRPGSCGGQQPKNSEKKKAKRKNFLFFAHMP